MRRTSSDIPMAIIIRLKDLLDTLNTQTDISTFRTK